MAISQGNIILASDVGLSSGTTATASGINSAMGTSVSQGALIQPFTGTKYFIKNGKFVSGIGHEAKGSIWQNWTTQSDHIWLTTYTGGSNDYMGANVTPAVVFSGQWKKLIIDSSAAGDTSYIGLTTNHNAKDLNFYKQFTYFTRSGNHGRRTDTFNITGASGTYYIGIRLKSWIWFDGVNVNGSGGVLRIYNLYLST